MSVSAVCRCKPQAVFCSLSPPNPGNGTFDCGAKSQPGTVCKAACDEAFNGEPSATCGTNGKWGPVTGTCQPNLPLGESPTAVLRWLS
jgi:hypothetical protein